MDAREANGREGDAETLETTTARAGAPGTSRGAETYGETREDAARDALRDVLRAFEAVRPNDDRRPTTDDPTNERRMERFSSHLDERFDTD